MAEQQAIGDREHAVEFLKILDAWLPLRFAERTRLGVQVRVEPKGLAATILKGLETHGRGAARFVASQTGSSSDVLWWVNGQLSDEFSRDEETASAFHRIRHIVDNALLQVERGGQDREGMQDAAREYLKFGAAGGEADADAGAARKSQAGRTATMIKVLLLSANPVDAPLSIDEEFRAIDAKIRASEHRDHVNLIKHGAVRLEDLPGLLMRYQPHVVHFSGHGDSGAIELTSADGLGHLVPPEALAEILRALKDNVRVVLLNACESAPQAEAIVSVIDCAVGMNDEIKDGAAIAFAAAFYEALGYGRSVQTAFNLGIIQMTAAGADRSLAKLYKKHGVQPADIVLVTPQRP